MARKATPDLLVDILDVSQETPDDVVLGKPRPASSRLIDVFAAEEGWPAAGIPDSGRMPDLVPIAAIDDNPYQPRLTYSGIEELAENIRLNGLLQPPAGRMIAGGRWQIAFGHRRLRAYRLLHEQHGGDWGRIPMVVMRLSDDKMARHAWSENHNREDVSAVEEARLFQRMINDFGFTQQEIADDVGKSRSAVANTLRLLQLPDAAQGMIERGEISERHGRELLRLSGAPAWLEQAIAELAGKKPDQVPPVAEMRKQISRLIALDGRPIPEQSVSMTDRWMSKSTFEPPPWPVDGFAPKSPDVRGVCGGCAWLVTFDREPAPRCTDSKCHAAKGRLWAERDRERQKAAAMEAAAAAFAPPAAMATETAADPQGEAGGVRWTKRDGYSVSIFGSGNAPAALVERGLCGAETCECFALCLEEEYCLSASMIGPDRTAAPRAVYVCENSARLRAQRNRLEEIEAPEKAEQRKAAIADKSAETKATKQLLSELWEEIGVDGLSNSQASMATVVAALSGATYNHEKYDKLDLDELWDTLFWWLAGKRCQINEWSDAGNRVDRWDLAKATQLRDQLRGELHRPARQPGPGDSQATGWQDGWDEDDIYRYAICKQNPGYHLNHLDRIDRPRVLLRLIEEMGDNKPLRSGLWRRHNELVSQETPDHP